MGRGKGFVTGRGGGGGGAVAPHVPKPILNLTF